MVKKTNEIDKVNLQDKVDKVDIVEIALEDDNKENIFQKNTKNSLSNRQFGKDITNSISNLLDRNHSGYITKRNSFAQKELTKVLSFL